MSFTAGPEPKAEGTAVNRPTDEIDFFFYKIACALFLVMYLHEITICGHFLKLYRVQLVLLCMKHST